MTNDAKVPLKFSSTVQQGFVCLMGRLHPLDHQFTQFLDLELGENQIDVGFIDGDLKYYPTKQTKLTIYRSVKLNDDVQMTSRLITELLTTSSDSII